MILLDVGLGALGGLLATAAFWQVLRWRSKARGEDLHVCSGHPKFSTLIPPPLALPPIKKPDAPTAGAR